MCGKVVGFPHKMCIFAVLFPHEMWVNKPQIYTYSSKPPRKSKKFCNLSANYPQIISKQQPVNY